MRLRESCSDHISRKWWFQDWTEPRSSEIKSQIVSTIPRMSSKGLKKNGDTLMWGDLDVSTVIN